jgi:hypothetical protein
MTVRHYSPRALWASLWAGESRGDGEVDLSSSLHVLSWPGADRRVWGKGWNRMGLPGITACSSAETAFRWRELVRYSFAIY